MRKNVDSAITVKQLYKLALSKLDIFRHTAYSVKTSLNTFLIMLLFMHFEYELVI